MTHKHLVHAEHIVDAFKSKLSKSGVEHVGEKHFDELSLLIESAISTAVLEEVEHAMDKVQQTLTSLRREVEHL
ncbi:MAG: phosphatase [Gammaproteobacteria bacterium]|nr:phosphatase [Gammaproteobacteria bacterium]MCF6231343.1 phosphatase [Gammaproteobacteria bacterium]